MTLKGGNLASEGANTEGPGTLSKMKSHASSTLGQRGFLFCVTKFS